MPGYGKVTRPAGCSNKKISHLGITNWRSTNPKVVPLATICRDDILQSEVFLYTVFPHHLWIVFAPIDPLAGYSKLPPSLTARSANIILKTAHQKNMINDPSATLESRAAESTSNNKIMRGGMVKRVRNVQLYFAHHEKCRLLIMYWNINATIAQGT